MSKVAKFLILSIVVISFCGCGEAFRGTSSNGSIQQTDSEFFNEDGERRSFTDANVDRDILVSYTNELRGQESSTQAVTSVIRAFDMVLKADANNNFSLQGRLVVSCSENYTFNRNVNTSELQSMAPVSLGTQGPFRLEIRCTNQSCQELVAVIRKVSGSNQGTVLVGLAVGGQRDKEILYVSRSVEYQPYFASFAHVQRFEQVNSCSVSSNSNDDDDNQTIGDILTDQAVEIGTDLLKGWLNDKFGI